MEYLLKTGLATLINDITLTLSHSTEKMKVFSCVIHPHTILEEERRISPFSHFV